MNKSVKEYEKHFIFNALNTIKYFCRVNNEKASEFIAIFANILNYMTFDERKYVSIIEELDLLCYVETIQKVRFNNEVNLTTEKLEDISIPKGIIIYIFLLGYNLNILRKIGAKFEIRATDNLIKIKMISDFKISIEETKENEFFKKVYESINNLNCKLNLSLKESELNFDIFL